MNENGCDHKDDRSLAEELESYKNRQKIHAADRDGDLYVIECPDCGSTDLNVARFFGCKKCHTRFSVYTEDGLREFELETGFGEARVYDEGLNMIALNPEKGLATVGTKS
jgi:hypothetical protein